MNFEKLMRISIAQAVKSGEDVPVGAILASAAGEVVAFGWNQKERLGEVTAHAEILAIKQASQLLGDWRLSSLTLVVTLEPCVMCAGAIVAARIPRVVFGAWDPKAGASGSLYDLLRDSRLGGPSEVTGGVLEAQCSRLLSDFFKAQRKKN